MGRLSPLWGRKVPLFHTQNNTRNLCAGRSPQESPVIDALQKIQNDAFAWIFSTDVKRPKLLQGILGALSVEEGFSHLRCSFQLHIDHSDKDNPLRKLIRASTLKDYIYQLRSNKLYTAFLSLPDLPPSYPLLKAQMSDFLLSRRSGILSSSTSILVNYISRSARTHSLIDQIFTAPIPYQRRFLTWQRGIMFFGMKYICGESWTRRRIPCLPQIILTLDLDSKFDECQTKFSKNFSKLDFLLNERAWDQAAEALDNWHELLSKKPLITSPDCRGFS